MAYVNEALALRRTNLRSDHPSIGASAHLAGKIKMAQGDAAGAEPLLAEALRIRQAELTAGDQHTLDTLEEYAACLAALGKDAEAAKHFEEAIALLRSTDRGDSPQAHRLLARLADLAG
jgi:tetratricopeptide (TPR) repeat protein